MLRSFYADTEEVALGLAQEFLESLDSYEQGTLWSSGVSPEGTAYAIVQHYGLD